MFLFQGTIDIDVFFSNGFAITGPSPLISFLGEILQVLADQYFVSGRYPLFFVKDFDLLQIREIYWRRLPESWPRPAEPVGPSHHPSPLPRPPPP